jgi:Holliday junction resolvase RusA-like endonuclease
VEGNIVNEPERFVIPGLPPTTNHGYGLSVRGGHAVMYKTQTAKDWQYVASLFLIASHKRQDWGDRDLYVSIVFAGKNKGRDIDGGVKLALDTLAEGLGFNDKQVVELRVFKTVNSLEETTIHISDGRHGGPRLD